MGYGVIDADIANLKITHASGFTIRGSKLDSMRDWDIESYSERFARIRAHSTEFTKVLEELRPDVVICESPFYNPRRPNAFEVLVEVMTMLRNTLYTWDSWKTLNLVDPPTAKKSFGAPGNAKKEAMFEVLKANPDLQFPGILELDEHSIDAVAVGYHLYKQISKSRL